MTKDYRLDELAHAANLPTTTVRLYRTKGLLSAPRLEGRTGWYDESHLSRLRLVGRLQDQGFSLAGIGQLIEQWERGKDLDSVLGVEAELVALLAGPTPITLDPLDLLEHFPSDVMTPELMQRAAALDLIAVTERGQVQVKDERFLDAGGALARLGVPLDVVLDEWEVLTDHTDVIARRFVAVFEDHLAPAGWKEDLDAVRTAELAMTLSQLQRTAREVVSAALDASTARAGSERLAELMPNRSGADENEPGR